MPKFKTYTERMNHRQGKLIPESIWIDNDLFGESLNDTVLSLMKTKEEHLIDKLNESIIKLNNSWLKKQAWLAIALSHPNLNLLTLKKIATLLEFNNQQLFSLLTILGNIKLVDEFTKQQNDYDILNIILFNQFESYRKAAEHGHTSILEYLETKVTPIKMIRAFNNYAYKYAASNGYLSTLKHLEAKAPDLIQEMIKAENFYAYRYAAARGHFKILQHLEKITPDLISAMIKANNFYAFCKSAQNNHIEISHWMFSKSSNCFAYAEMHTNEYKTIIELFIEQQLKILHHNAIHIPPNHIFNIIEPEQTKICFYIIRNLIRHNDRTQDDEIRFLLNIPSVKALAHDEVTTGQPNELIRLALTIGNQEAATILLNIPKVRKHTEENDFYRSEINGQLDLSQLAKNQESSMVALTHGEQKRLNQVLQHYLPILKLQGVTNLINNFQEQLKQRYKNNPAFIVNEKQIRITLPMDFYTLQTLNFSKNEYQQALEAYYQHKDHTAWRYLQKPNPWIDPEAFYVYLNVKTNERWSSFEEYQPLIALFWLAACDESIPPTDDHTLETRLNHFIDELSLIGRAHNWDNTRHNNQEEEEEYDDLKGDKPACYSGVKRRLFQSVLGHPLISILTEDVILGEIRDFARDYFQSKITEENRPLLKEAFNDYLMNINELKDENRILLLSLNIPNEKQLEFERYLSDKYGAQYTEDYPFQQLVRNKLSMVPKINDFFSQCHILILDNITNFYQMLKEQNQQSTQINKLVFFNNNQPQNLPENHHNPKFGC